MAGSWAVGCGGGWGEGGRSVAGIVGRWRTVGIPEVDGRQVCREGLAVEEVGGCLVGRKTVGAGRGREGFNFVEVGL